MRLLKNSIFLAVASTHLVVDMLGSQLALLAAFLSQSLSLTNVGIGMVVAGYRLSSALTQPVFGWLADRVGPRWLVAGGLLWTAGFISLAVASPGPATLPFLVLAGLGSGAFHPSGAMEATRLGQEYFSGRATTAAAYFFLFGQIGWTLGPAVEGALLGGFSVYGLFFVTALALPVALFVAFQLGPQVRFEDHAKSADIGLESELHAGWLAFLAFVLLVAMRSWASDCVVTFLPKYILEQGVQVANVGLLTATFMGGIAVGGLVGGALSDRLDKRTTILMTLLPAAPLLFLLPRLGTTGWVFLVIPLTGALLGASHSPIVVLAQSLMPGRMATASGLILGFIFSAGALGTLVTGSLADLYGLQIVFQLSAFLAFGAAVLTLTLQGKRKASPGRAAAETLPNSLGD
jgi:FSR family fosmidomycin resistance protein-like MFS transporter